MSAGPAAIRVAAHRGGARLGPENSLLACRRALTLGVDLVEVDVHLTADDVPVLLHDPTLDRTTTARGPVRARRRAELTAVRLRGPDGAPTDERLPALAELLALMAPAPAGLLVELKAGPDGAPYPGIEARVLEAVRDAGLGPRTVVMAFDAPTLGRLRALDATIATALLVGRRGAGDWRGLLGTAAAVGATHLGVEHRRLDASTAAAARGAGLVLLAWTVNGPAALRRVVALGADVVVTDRPDVALALLGRGAPGGGPQWRILRAAGAPATEGGRPSPAWFDRFHGRSPCDG